MASSYDPHWKQPKPYAIIGGKSVVWNAHKQILVMRRSQKSTRPGGWDFPGGQLDEGEDPYVGVAREIFEETGLTAVHIRPIDVVSVMTKEHYFAVIIGYESQVDSDIVTVSWEHDSYQWISPEEATKLDLPPTHQRFLKKAIELSP